MKLVNKVLEILFTRPLLDKIEEVIRERNALGERAGQAEVQLAGCGCAALGWSTSPAKQGDWGWSPAYDDTLLLRRAFEKLANGKSPQEILEK